MSQKESQLPINEALLEEAMKLKRERALIRERLNKIEAKKAEVSPSVYQRVRQDYSAKLEEATTALIQKKADIDRELATLYETRSKVTENLSQHKDRLEELKFRHQLGEYNDEAFKEQSKEASEKAGKFEKVLYAVNQNIERYEAIFADEEGIAEEPKNPEASKKVPMALFEKEGSDYMIEPKEEEDYFSPESATSKSISVSESTKKTFANVGHARAIIIEGDNAGKEYLLKKENTIGRANTNMIVLKDSKISRQHAVIKQTGNEFVILDLNSSNGVYVNHERIKEHVLGDGDEVKIGDFVLQFKI